MTTTEPLGSSKPLVVVRPVMSWKRALRTAGSQRLGSSMNKMKGWVGSNSAGSAQRVTLKARVPPSGSWRTSSSTVGTPRRSSTLSSGALRVTTGNISMRRPARALDQASRSAWWPMSWSREVFPMPGAP